MTRIDARARFDLIRYANSWEDADVLCAALRPAPGKRMLAIASGGDNAFALLAEGADVVAVDLSDTQLALVALKKVAIAHLDDAAFLAFLGVPARAAQIEDATGNMEKPLGGAGDTLSISNSPFSMPAPGDRRLETFRALEDHLDAQTRAYWNANLSAIERGLVHCGKFERYFRMFRRFVLPLVHSRAEAAELLREKTREERMRFYAEEWNSWRWRAMFQLFFSRRVMGRAGRDPEFFRYVQGSVAERIMKRAAYALTELPTHANPYLAFIFTGNYTTTLPRYLRKLDAVRANLDRLTLARGSIDETTRGKFDGFYLSDIFEYVDPPTVEAMYGRILEMSNPNARIAYWNLLVPRRVPAPWAESVTECREEAAALFAQDLAFFYSAFVLEQVR
jgi:S-adenosylmethionine-diacylglycerol 3-amino-3-carboxypropyl transferase